MDPGLHRARLFPATPTPPCSRTTARVAFIGTVDISTTKVAEKGGRKKGVAGGHMREPMEVTPRRARRPLAEVDKNALESRRLLRCRTVGGPRDTSRANRIGKTRFAEL